MATLVDNPKYGHGHEVIIKDKISAAITEKFLKYGYKPGVTVFSIFEQKDIPKDQVEINLLTGNKIIFLKDASNRIIKLTGSSSSINASFNHYSENSKSNTSVLTEIKETISMEVFKHFIENGRILEEDKCVEISDNIKKGLYATVYYESAIKQLNAFKPIMKQNKGYDYERQGEKLTKKIYETARKLTKKANDNWNPADVWMIKKGLNLTPLYEAESANELNSLIAQGWKDKTIIPISLKQVTAKEAKFGINDPAKMLNSKLDLDLSYKQIALSGPFKNVIIETKSGFTVRAAFKGSGASLNVSLEGSFKGAGYQLGGIDAKQFPNHIQTKYGYRVRSGNSVSTNDLVKAKKELKEAFSKYRQISNQMKSYDEAIEAYENGTDLDQKRFINLISYLYALTVAPKTKAQFEETMKYCYFSAKKVSSDSCLYVILN